MAENATWLLPGMGEFVRELVHMTMKAQGVASPFVCQALFSEQKRVIFILMDRMTGKADDFPLQDAFAKGQGEILFIHGLRPGHQPYRVEMCNRMAALAEADAVCRDGFGGRYMFPGLLFMAFLTVQLLMRSLAVFALLDGFFVLGNGRNGGAEVLPFAGRIRCRGDGKDEKECQCDPSKDLCTIQPG